MAIPTQPLLPRSPLPSARAEALASQRNRLIVAITEAVAENGYGSTSVADVIARAGISRRAFYEHFADKEDCLLAAYGFGVASLQSAIDRRERDAGDGWLARAEASLGAYLEALASEPAFARAYLIEVFAASDRARALYLAIVERFTQILSEAHERARAEDPTIVPVSRATIAIVAGSVNRSAMVFSLEDRIEELPKLLPELLGVLSATLAGHDERLRARTAA